MRHLIVGAGILVIAASAHAQTTAAATPDSPPLTKTVVIESGDSPLVRAAKRAVASRQGTDARRVITVRTSAAGAGRGRFAEATGPISGPQVPAITNPAKPNTSSQKSEAQRKAAEAQKAHVDAKLKQLAEEEAMVAAEADEPYGGDMEEDEVDARLGSIEEQRRELQPVQQPPPPKPPQ
ncbi:MAG TPA: hypothetical protein VGQ76_11195 [Thermoanaerobaculia bacterium]|jgi:hypothetical protein|nr:hypothetical protein [Thermoanaerobaculia bacterium]